MEITKEFKKEIDKLFDLQYGEKIQENMKDYFGFSLKVLLVAIPLFLVLGHLGIALFIDVPSDWITKSVLVAIFCTWIIIILSLFMYENTEQNKLKKEVISLIMNDGNYTATDLFNCIPYFTIKTINKSDIWYRNDLMSVWFRLEIDCIKRVFIDHLNRWVEGELPKPFILDENGILKVEIFEKLENYFYIVPDNSSGNIARGCRKRLPFERMYSFQRRQPSEIYLISPSSSYFNFTYVSSIPDFVHSELATTLKEYLAKNGIPFPQQDGEQTKTCAKLKCVLAKEQILALHAAVGHYLNETESFDVKQLISKIEKEVGKQDVEQYVLILPEVIAKRADAKGREFVKKVKGLDQYWELDERFQKEGVRPFLEEIGIYKTETKGKQGESNQSATKSVINNKKPNNNLKEKVKSETLSTSEESIPEDRPTVHFDLSGTTFYTNPQFYPYCKFPQLGTKILKHRKGSTKRKGKLDLAFKNTVKKLLKGEYTVSNSTRILNADTTSFYEPDVAVIASDGSIKIDIEIDEPYAAHTKEPLHFVGLTRDRVRDQFFANAGWIVLRFSEYQIVKFETQCVEIIQLVLAAATQNNKELLGENFDEIKTEKWTKEECEQLAESNWRNEYLGTDFGYQELPEEDIVQNDISVTDEEREERKQMTATQNDESSGTELRLDNPEKPGIIRTPSVVFNKELHTYHINGVKFRSVSELLDGYFEKFNPDKAISNIRLGRNYASSKYYGLTDSEIIAIWNEQKDLGTELHSLIEKSITTNTLTNHVELSNEISYFRDFRDNFGLGNIIETEEIVYDTENKVAGTLDLICEREGEITLLDWKRSKNIGSEVSDKFLLKENNFNLKTCAYPIDDLQDTKLNRYKLQLNMYRHMYNLRAKKPITRMFLVVLHSKYSKYHLVEIEDMEAEVRMILSS